jgi:hypothetical protein
MTMIYVDDDDIKKTSSSKNVENRAQNEGYVDDDDDDVDGLHTIIVRQAQRGNRGHFSFKLKN